MRAALVSSFVTAAVVLAAESICATPRPVVITPADRVRIQIVPDPQRVPAPLRDKFVGSITDISESKITVVMEGGEPAVVHRDLIAGLETSVDRGSRATHTLVGGLIGAAVGAAVFVIAVSAQEDDSDYFKLYPHEVAPIGAIYGLLPGLLIGALCPAGKTWEPVPLESVEWSPEPRGVR